MLVIILEEKDGEMILKEYELIYPYSLYSFVNSGKNFLWNLNSVEFKNIKNSFRISCAKKMFFSTDFVARPEHWVNGYVSVTGASIIPNSTQCFLYTKKELFYINEKNPTTSLNDEKKKFPYFLFMNYKNALQSLQFFIDYEDNIPLKGEEIKISINLFEEEK